MQARVRQKVDDRIKNKSKNPISEDKLIEKVAEEYGIRRDKAEERINALINQGTLFEPEPGKIKMLRT